MVPQIPTADTAIFSKNKNGELEFRGMQQHEPYIDIDNLPTFPEVYRNAYHGDSGGPVMRKIRDRSGKERHVLVAVIAHGSDITRLKRSNSKCLTSVCKLTEEVVKWIKKIDKGDFEYGK